MKSDCISEETNGVESAEVILEQIKERLEKVDAGEGVSVVVGIVPTNFQEMGNFGHSIMLFNSNLVVTLLLQKVVDDTLDEIIIKKTGVTAEEIKHLSQMLLDLEEDGESEN